MIEQQRRAWLDSCNPTVKLALVLIASCAMLLLLDPLPLLVLYALAAVGVGLGCALPWRSLLLAQVPFALFGIGLVAVNALSRPGTEVPGLPMRVTVEGLTVGAALAVRTLAIGVLAVGFLASTPPRELMVSLVQHARLSPRFAFALLAGHRMLDQMPREWSAIRAAHAVRAPLRRDGRPRWALADFARGGFALLVGAVRSSQRIALALEARGLREGPRTVWRPVPLGARDAVLAAVVLAALAAVTVSGVQR